MPLDDTRDAIAVLVEDHREFESVFRSLERMSPGDPGRRAVADCMIVDLVRHAVAEEEYLYPITRMYLPDGDAIAQREIRQHGEAEEIMKRLELLDVQDPHFDATLQHLIDTLRAHMREEEQEVFPRLAALASPERLQELGDKINTARRLAPPGVHRCGRVQGTPRTARPPSTADPSVVSAGDIGRSRR